MRYEEIYHYCDFCGGGCSGYKSISEECFICGAEFQWLAPPQDEINGWYRKILNGPVLCAEEVGARILSNSKCEYLQPASSVVYMREINERLVEKFHEAP